MQSSSPQPAACAAPAAHVATGDKPGVMHLLSVLNAEQWISASLGVARYRPRRRPLWFCTPRYIQRAMRTTPSCRQLLGCGKAAEIETQNCVQRYVHKGSQGQEDIPTQHPAYLALDRGLRCDLG